MKDYRTNWQMPALPLGPAIREDSPPMKDHPVYKRVMGAIKFENKVFRPDITEADCRQIKSKGAATAPQERTATSHPVPDKSPCVAPTITPAFKNGDRVRVLKQAGDYEIGATGVVSAVDLYDGWIKADMSDGRNGVNWKPTSLELIAPTNTAEADAEGWIKWDFREGLPLALKETPKARIYVRGEDGFVLGGDRLVDHQVTGAYANARAYKLA